MNQALDFTKFCLDLDRDLTLTETIKLFELELFETQRQIELKKFRNRDNRHFSQFFAQSYLSCLEHALNRLKGHDQGYVFLAEHQRALENVITRIRSGSFVR